MRPVLTGMMMLALTIGVAGQDAANKPALSKDPLTEEQVAVYRAVLEFYTKGGTVGVLNIADRTEPLSESGVWSDEECFKSFESPGGSHPVVHKLNGALPLSEHYRLVDPDRQQEKVSANDPQHLMTKAIDEHEDVSKKEIDDSVKRAFEAGLFTLSEISFDKQHQHALVAYSFVCGGLCGHGGLLVLTKRGKRWKVRRTCASWIS